MTATEATGPASKYVRAAPSPTPEMPPPKNGGAPPPYLLIALGVEHHPSGYQLCGSTRGVTDREQTSP